MYFLFFFVMVKVHSAYRRRTNTTLYNYMHAFAGKSIHLNQKLKPGTNDPYVTQGIQTSALVNEPSQVSLAHRNRICKKAILFWYGMDNVANPECLSRIRIFSIPDPGSASKNLNIKN
jgi:hypothetical protein